MAVLPVESSHTGTIQSTLDALLDPANPQKLYVVGEFAHAEPHHLLTLSDQVQLAEITEVRSHGEVLAQCSTFLNTQVPNARLVVTIGTGAAAEEIKAQADAKIACIAGDFAAKSYGLHTVAKDIANHKHTNFTRMWLISKSPAVPERHMEPRTSVVVRLPNRPGALLRLIAAFSLRDVNVARIESRPHTESIIRAHSQWEYAMVLEVDGTPSVDPRVAQALEHLNEFCNSVRVLGSYPRYLIDANFTQPMGLVGL